MNKFLGYILGIDTPSGASIVSIETVPMYLAFFLSILAGVTLFIISIRLYQAEQIKLPPRIKIFALCSRLAAIFAFSMLCQLEILLNCVKPEELHVNPMHFELVHVFAISTPLSQPWFL